MNGFTILPGDRYDAVIVATILEHWFHVLTGHASWSEVSYFYPYTRTIAQTDAYFLIGLAYFPFRLAGLDPFVATELAGWIIKTCGFVGAYLLCRKAFSLSFGWALLAAVLFTMSNGMTQHVQRIQLSTVAFAPGMALLLWIALKAFFEGKAAQFKRAGMAAGVFFGAWCMTCFYMAWFFTFLFTVLAVVLLAKGGRSGLSLFKDRLLAHYGAVMAVLGTACVSLIPFIYAFLPKSQEVGVRTYESVLERTVPLEGILQVGHENILLGRIYNAILSRISPGYAPSGEYYNTGIAILLFVFFVLGCVRFMKKSARPGAGIILQSLVIATLITWMFTLNIGGWSPWFFVYHLFPGAQALNVVAAYQILLALPVVIVAVKYLSLRRMALPFLLLVPALLVAEELNRPYLNLERQAELARIELPRQPPAECRAFYVSGWPAGSVSGFTDWINDHYAHNVSAMLIAQDAHIPTVNGIASFNPPDWDFAYPNKPDYDERVLAYARKHGIAAGFCKLDLGGKQWSVVKAE